MVFGVGIVFRDQPLKLKPAAVSLDPLLEFELAKPRDELVDSRFGFGGQAFQVAGTTSTFC
jgi:hypothetical protein